MIDDQMKVKKRQVITGSDILSNWAMKYCKESPWNR